MYIRAHACSAVTTSMQCFAFGRDGNKGSAMYFQAVEMYRTASPSESFASIRTIAARARTRPLRKAPRARICTIARSSSEFCA